LDTTYPYIRITGKGNKTRVVPLTNEFIENYKYYLKLYHPQKDDTQYLFYSICKENKWRMSSDNVQRIVKKYGNQERIVDPTIPEMHPHILRHSFGALMYRKGLSLAEVAKLLGHEYLSTTEIYAETDIDMINKALETINKDSKDIESRWEELSEDDKLRVFGFKN